SGVRRRRRTPSYASRNESRISSVRGKRESGLAARRVFNIAKDLGIDAKAIVAKCHAEGIPETVIKNHMSTVSAGLEATIREWFSGGAQSTAVETAEKVDLEKVKVRPRRATKTRSEESAEPPSAPTSDETGTVVAEPPKRAARKIV